MGSCEREAKREEYWSDLKKFRIFIDTSSLLSESSEKFLASLFPFLDREKQKLIVPLSVYKEIAKFADHPENCVGRPEDFQRRAARAKGNIALLQRTGHVDVFGDPGDDEHADNVFLRIFKQFRTKYHLALITQDGKLTNGILNLNRFRSDAGNHEIAVFKIGGHGTLSRQRQWVEEESIGENEKFVLATAVTTVSGSMKASFLPEENEDIYAEIDGQHREFTLTRLIASGGEGSIYDLDDGRHVVKIYKYEKLSRIKYEKIRLLLGKSLRCEGICFPVAMAYNTENEFVGYVMEKAHGKELQRSVFIPPLFRKTFPGWSKVETVRLCVTILRKLKYLHDRNIILGDINPNNILVVSPEEVYFVDTDSYQIEGFPCPVGTINFTAPEIQKKPFNEFLRTPGQERFAVATLLFMIMLPGKPPYSLRGGEDQIENILRGEFAYPSGGKSSGRTPQGPWRFCWSHLPSYLKDDFYETFMKNGSHSQETTRYSTGEWLQKFLNYSDLLASGFIEEQDVMSLDLFPSRLKRSRGGRLVRCRLCGSEVPGDWVQQGMCLSCLKAGRAASA